MLLHCVHYLPQVLHDVTICYMQLRSRSCCCTCCCICICILTASSIMRTGQAAVESLAGASQSKAEQSDAFCTALRAQRLLQRLLLSASMWQLQAILLPQRRSDTSPKPRKLDRWAPCLSSGARFEPSASAKWLDERIAFHFEPTLRMRRMLKRDGAPFCHNGSLRLTRFCGDSPLPWGLRMRPSPSKSFSFLKEISLKIFKCFFEGIHSQA